MCLIYAVTKKVPPLAHLQHAEKQNDDGGGMAWVEGGKVHFQKGMEAKDIHIKMKNLQAPAIIHFRIATDGPVCAELTHPFPISKDCPPVVSGTADMVLAHNGRWTAWRTVLLGHVRDAKIPLPDGPWSDSRAMAFIAAHWGIGYLQLLLASSSDSTSCEAGRLCFLSPKGLAMHPLDDWTRMDDGGWYQSRPLSPPSSNTVTPLSSLVKTQKGNSKPLPPIPGGKHTTPPQPPSRPVESEEESLTTQEYREMLTTISDEDREKLFTQKDVGDIIANMKGRYTVVE